MIQQEMEMDPDIPLRVDLFNSSGTSCIIEVVERCGSFFFFVWHSFVSSTYHREDD